MLEMVTIAPATDLFVKTNCFKYDYLFISLSSYEKILHIWTFKVAY